MKRGPFFSQRAAQRPGLTAVVAAIAWGGLVGAFACNTPVRDFSSEQKDEERDASPDDDCDDCDARADNDDADDDRADDDADDDRADDDALPDDDGVDDDTTDDDSVADDDVGPSDDTDGTTDDDAPSLSDDDTAKGEPDASTSDDDGALDDDGLDDDGSAVEPSPDAEPDSGLAPCVGSTCGCNEGDERPCSEGDYLGACAEGVQSCDAEGNWGECDVQPLVADTCVPGNDATCDGTPNEDCECLVGQAECVAASPSTQRRVCTSAGTWGAPLDCPFVCAGAGECGGSCVPGTRECNAGAPRECTVQGAWQAESACAAGTGCQGAGQCGPCASGTYSSGGVCVAWTSCAAGKYVSSAGTASADRQCSNCAPGSYSTTTNATSCTPWTPCPAGTVEQTAGTSTSDRVCTPVAGPGCAGVGATCGGGGNESCCQSLAVTGGDFNVVNDATHPATVSAVALDKFEVTVGRFRPFKAAWDAGYRPAAGSGKHTHLNSGSGLRDVSGSGWEPGWNTAWAANVSIDDTTLDCQTNATWTPTAESNEAKPMNCVNWYEAYAFCIWDGAFLPSEREWNYAAAGGGDSSGQRVFPWSVPSTSTTIDSTRAVYSSAAISVVGSKTAGAGRYGHMDLAGNVWEWTLDWEVELGGACVDCAAFSNETGDRILRGGGYGESAPYLQNDFRTGGSATARGQNTGFRCARPN